MLAFIFVLIFCIFFMAVHVAWRLLFGKVVFQSALDGFLLDVRSKEATSRIKELGIAVKRLDTRLDKSSMSKPALTDHLELVLSDCRKQPIRVFDFRFPSFTYIIYVNVNSDNMTQEMFEDYSELVRRYF